MQDNFPNPLRNVALATTYPTLEEAKKICKEYVRPLNSHVILLNVVAPTVTAGGIAIGKAAFQEAQQNLNAKGMLVVLSPDGEQVDTVPRATDKVYEGEYVKLDANAHPAFSKEIVTEELMEGIQLTPGQEVTPLMCKKYAILCMHKSYLSCVITQPK